jgi:RNA polymerase sigma-B factor
MVTEHHVLSSAPIADTTSPSAPKADSTSPTSDGSARGRRTKELYDSLRDKPAAARQAVYDEVAILHLDVAAGVARRYRGRGIPYDDLFQVACCGLVKASRGFDPERGDNFMVYAVPTMLGEVKRYFRDHAWMVRPPRRVQLLQAQIAAASESWRQRNGTAPSAADLAGQIGVSRDAVDDAMGADDCFAPPSLDRPVTDDGSTWGELVGAVDPGFERSEAVATLAPICRRLTDRDKRILYLRYFQGWTQAQIAADLDVSQMHVSRQLRRILDQLRLELGR